MEKFNGINVRHKVSSTYVVKLVSSTITMLYALIICRALLNIVPGNRSMLQQIFSTTNGVDDNQKSEAIKLNFVSDWTFNQSHSLSIVNLNDIARRLERTLIIQPGMIHIESILIDDEAKIDGFQKHSFQKSEPQAVKCDRLEIGQSHVVMTIHINYPMNCDTFAGCKQNLMDDIKNRFIKHASNLLITVLLKDGTSHNIELTHCSNSVDTPSVSFLVRSCVTREIQEKQAELSLRGKVSGKTGANDILYHGGPVMTAPVAYIIWYGNWTGNNATSLIENFFRGLGSTPWWVLTREYNDTAPITFGSSITDQYSQGANLNNSRIWAVVQRALTSSLLPANSNGIYFVLSSANVTEPGFCTSFCGWHTYGYWNSNQIKFSWVGDPSAQCPRSCGAQTLTPNGNFGADSMISVIAHEATETATDPLLNAWYDNDGEENADKCSWTFGNTSVASNGARFNVISNGLYYFVQQNWRLRTQDCGLASASNVTISSTPSPSSTTTSTSPTIRTAYYSSILDSNHPCFSRYYGSNGVCYYYEVLQVTVSTGTTCTLRSNSTLDTYGFLYNPSFDPVNPGTNMISYNDDSEGNVQFLITYTLQAGSNYYLVVTTYSPLVTGLFTAAVSCGSQPTLVRVYITPPTTLPTTRTTTTTTTTRTATTTTTSRTTTTTTTTRTATTTTTSRTTTTTRTATTTTTSRTATTTTTSRTTTTTTTSRTTTTTTTTRTATTTTTSRTTTTTTTTRTATTTTTSRTATTTTTSRTTTTTRTATTTTTSRTTTTTRTATTTTTSRTATTTTTSRTTTTTTTSRTTTTTTTTRTATTTTTSRTTTSVSPIVTTTTASTQLPILRCLGSLGDPLCPGVMTTAGSVVTVNPSNRILNGGTITANKLFFNLEDSMTRSGYVRSVTIQYSQSPSSAARIYIYTVIPVAGSYIVCSQYAVPTGQISTTQYIQTYNITNNTINVINGAYIGIGIQDNTAIVAATSYGSLLFLNSADQSVNVPGRSRLYFQPYGLPYGAKLNYTIIT